MYGANAMMYKIVETDNFGRDYPNEKFVNLPSMSQDAAIAVADEINKHLSGDHHERIWMVVPSDYKLSPGFEP